MIVVRLQITVQVATHVMLAQSVHIRKFVALELITQLALQHQLVLLVQQEAIVFKDSKLHVNLVSIVILQSMRLITNNAQSEHIQLQVQAQLHALNVMEVRLAHKLV